jgi:hypothetical protein
MEDASSGFGPSYYGGPALSAQDVIEAVTAGLDGPQGWCLGNVLKYALRAGRKTEDPWEDIAKARDYAHRLCTGEWPPSHGIPGRQ